MKNVRPAVKYGIYFIVTFILAYNLPSNHDSSFFWYLPMVLAINAAFVFWVASGKAIFKLLLGLVMPFLLIILTYLIVVNLLTFEGKLLPAIIFSVVFISLSVCVWSFLLTKKK